MKARDFFILFFCFGVLLFSIEKEGSLSLKKAFTHTIADHAYFAEHINDYEDSVLPPPIVADINGDGYNEMLVVREGVHLELVDLELDPRLQRRSGFHGLYVKERHILKTEDPNAKNVRVISGFTTARIDPFSYEHRIFVLASDWSLLCLNEQLDVLWDVPLLPKDDPTRDKTYPIDVSMLATPYRVQVNDGGIIIVGFQRNFKEEARIEYMERMEEETDPEEPMFFDLEDEVHYNYYAFDTKTGDFRWKHEVEDFQETEHERTYAHGEDDNYHAGEVHWRTFETEIISHLPHRFRHQNDVRMKLDRFTRYQDRGVKEHKEFAYGERAIPIFSGTPVASQKKGDYQGEKPPNVLVSHVPHGVEVIHLYTGKPLTQVAPLQEDVLFHDFDHSRSIDSARYFTASRAVFKVGPHQRATKCAALLYTGAPLLTEALFNTSICEPASFFHRLSPDSSIVTARAQVGNDPISAASPTLVRRWDDERQSHVNDIVYLTSNGMVTSISPYPVGGEVEDWKDFMERRVMGIKRGYDWGVNWQVKTTSVWGMHFQDSDDGEKKHRVMGEDVEVDLFPSIEAFHPSASSSVDDVILVAGRRTINILTSSGSIEAEEDLPGDIVAPIVFADIDNDGVQDVLATVHSGDTMHIVGYTVHTHRGMSTLSFLVIALLVAMLLMYISTGIQLKDPYYVKKNPEEHRSTD